MKKRNLWGIAAILMIFTAVVPASAALNFGILPDDAAIPLVIASEEGLFAESGAEVNLIPFNTALERDSALQAGKIDGAITDIIAVAFAQENGKQLKITSLANGRFTMLTAPGEDINSYRELSKVKIAISSGTIIDYLTDKFFADAGVDPSGLQEIAIPAIPVRLQMLMAGKIKAATMPEPLASLAESKGSRVIETTEAVGGAPVVMIFTREAIRNKTDEIESFYQAYSRSVQLVNQHHEEYRDIIVEKGRFPTSIRDVFQFVHYDQPHLPPVELVSDCLQWMEQNHLLKSDLQYDDLVSDRFVTEILQKGE